MQTKGGSVTHNDIPLMVFGAAFILFIVAVVIYLRREATDSSEAIEVFKSSQLQVQSVNEKYSSVIERIDNLSNEFKNCTMSLAELQHKYEALLEKSQKIEVTSKPQNLKLDLHLKQPLKIDMDKPFMMEFHKPVPIAIVNKRKKTPLLDRAGITDNKKGTRKGK